MIKTLQISSILAVVIAGLLFVSSIVFGAHQDKQIEDFLKSPGAKEQFQKVGEVKRPSSSQRSLLVEKAELFTGIINPPPPEVAPKPTSTAEPQPPEVPVDPPITAKFQLYGTVVCEANPESSLALIYEMGKGTHLVRQGAEIMYTTIEQILDGKIVVRNSGGTVEMAVEEGPAPASVVAGQPSTAAASPTKPATSISSSRNRITGGSTRTSTPPRTSIPPRTGDSGRRGPATPESVRSRITSKENARLAELGDRLKAAREAEADKISDETITEEDAKAAAILKKLSDSTEKDADGSKDPNSSEGPETPPSKPR
jgi:hypothetical protein